VVNGITPGGKAFSAGCGSGHYWASGTAQTGALLYCMEYGYRKTGQKPANWAEADAVFSTFLKMVGEAIIKPLSMNSRFYSFNLNLNLNLNCNL